MDQVFDRSVDQHVRTVEDLRAFVPPPNDGPRDKVIDHIDPLSERFIAAASLVFVATTRPDGILDVSPRGDPSGFVRLLDRHTLAIPDRPGNNRMDTVENILRNPQIGLIFVIPGHRDTLRVSGTAAVVRDAELGALLAVNGRPAAMQILVRVERVLSHCSKAFVRGKVWHPEEWPDTSAVPSLAEMLIAHAAMSTPVEELQAAIDEDRETGLY